MINLVTTQKTHLTVEETAELLARSRRTIYYWITAGKIDAVHTPYGQRIPVTEIRRITQYLDAEGLHHLTTAHPAIERVRKLSAQPSASPD